MPLKQLKFCNSAKGNDTEGLVCIECTCTSMLHGNLYHYLLFVGANGSEQEVENTEEDSLSDAKLGKTSENPIVINDQVNIHLNFSKLSFMYV